MQLKNFSLKSFKILKRITIEISGINLKDFPILDLEILGRRSSKHFVDLRLITVSINLIDKIFRPKYPISF